MKWTTTNDYLYGLTEKFKYNIKLALFDLDNTLITTKSGKTFPICYSDWKWKYDNIIIKLQELSKKNYSIIIISNQGGMEISKQDPNEWIKKLENIQNKLSIEICVFCATKINIYRKPYPTFFTDIIPHHVVEKMNFNKSFFCGDAVGRKGDFRDTDYKFALNCLLNFKTPEWFFKHIKTDIPPLNYIQKYNDTSFNFIPRDKEMIIMVGYPASGKSFISNKIRIEHNYEIINQDNLKTREKCLKFAEQFLQENKSIIIDSTNPNNDVRKIWINLAKKYNYNARIILMTTSYELSKHNNYYRYLKTKDCLIPEIAYRVYKSKFVKPKLTEGVSEIIETHCGKPDDYMYMLFLY